MSASTIDFHYGKHHKAYVDNTVAAIKGTALERVTLEQILQTSGVSRDARLFNNSAQAWNHDFFWQSIPPSMAPGPTATLAELPAHDFAGVGQFKSGFKQEALAHFASGWAWLVLQDGGFSELSRRFSGPSRGSARRRGQAGACADSQPARSL
jgi:Fe-Mn family superoxide dismutase